MNRENGALSQLSNNYDQNMQQITDNLLKQENILATKSRNTNSVMPFAISNNGTLKAPNQTMNETKNKYLAVSNNTLTNFGQMKSRNQVVE